MKKWVLLSVTMAICIFAYSQVVRAVDVDSLTLKVVCETESTSADGFGTFNIDALCPAYDVVVAGGYQCTDSSGNLTAINVLENTFHFSGTTPDGWQTIGTVLSGIEASCRVCATCTKGTGGS